MSGETKITETDYSADVAYERKSDREIRELAMACMGGSVFGSWMFQESEKEMIGHVFMPLLMLNEIQRKTLVRDGIVHFYEFMNTACPMAINGLPMFTSMKLLNREDTNRLSAAMKVLREFMKGEEGEE